MTKILVGVACCVVVFVVFLLLPSEYAYQRGGLLPPPIISDHFGSPENWIATLVRYEGGLPKSATILTSVRRNPDKYDISTDGILPHPGKRVEVFPVAHWEIESIRLTTPYGFLTAVQKGELIYSITIDFRVRYRGGEEALLRWDTWRYGINFWLLALDRGGGPAGDITVLK